MLSPILCLVYVLVSRAETWKPYNAPFKCYHRRGEEGGGRYYWMLIGWNRGQFIFWITKALLVIKRAWLLDWVFLLFAATIYWLQFNTMKQCNTINCIPPHTRDYNLPAVLSRTAFISTTQKKNAVTCMIRPNEARKGCRVCWRPKCNNCPKWNKVLNVITFGPGQRSHCVWVYQFDAKSTSV